MKPLIVTYTGGDLVVPQERMEAHGFRPGDVVVLQAAEPADADAERHEIESVLKEIARAAPGVAKDSERELRKLLDKLKPSD